VGLASAWRKNLPAGGPGIAIVPASLQRMQMDGVVYRRLAGTRPRAPLLLATRRGDASAVIRHFLDLVKRTARTFPRTVPRAGSGSATLGSAAPGSVTLALRNAGSA